MKCLDRYIAYQVLSAIFVILLVIVGLDLVFEFVEQTGEINDRYRFVDVLSYLMLRIPSRLYEFLPLASLVGCLVGLGMLASNSELTVMRAAGISIQRIVLAVMKPAMLLAVFALILGEYVVPVTEQKAQSSRALAQSAGQALRSKHGVWHREDNQFIHINAVEPGGKIHGVTRYSFNDQRQMVASSFAKSGVYSTGGWLLEDVVSTLFLGDRTQTEQVDEESWKSGLTPTLLSVIVVDPMDLSISGLWSYSSYLGEQGLDSNQYLLAFWSKVLQPAGIFALVLIAISFIFGPLRSVTVGQRIIAGVIVGLIFKFSQDLLGPASTVIGFTPLLATAIPIVICLIVGLFLLRKAA
nr:LPS export ABC transporter permease LptG [Neptunomonas japonica]